MTNAKIAQILYEIAIYLEMQDVHFEPRAYERVAQVLETMDRDAGDIYKKDGLKGLEEIPGVGKGIAQNIEELLSTGVLKKHKQLKKKTPVELGELMSVEGIGPKKIKILYKELGIRDLADLERAASGGHIQELAGFGKKTEENILQGIEFVKENSGRMLLGEALPIARAMMEDIKKLKDVKNISEAGSLRRRQETIGDIDILVSSEKPDAILEYFIRQKNVVKVWGRGNTKASIHVREGFDIDLRVLSPESWGSGLQYFTGSKAHNVATRKIAKKKKLKLSEYGVFPAKAGEAGKKSIAGKTEQEVYKAIGMLYIEPELREDTGELQEKNLPDLISYGSLKGDLQVQTSWTDGKHSIREMAEVARDLGLSYIAITDHTKSLAMTGGLDEGRLISQIKEIHELNKKIKGITILTGSEVDILSDGTLDIADDILAQLDVVGASVHSKFRMSSREMTDRIARAMENPHVDILFHPTGRLIQKREAYALDMERIIAVAKKTGTILEINAQPQRLDLRDEHIRMANEAGVKFCINSDAHHKNHFHYLEYGIAQARRGWVKSSDVINTYPTARMLSMLKR